MTKHKITVTIDGKDIDGEFTSTAVSSTDTIVVNVPDQLTQQQTERYVEQVKATFPNNHVIIMSGGTELVVTPQLESTDTIIINVPYTLNQQEANNYAATLQHTFPHNNVIIMTGGTELSVKPKVTKH